MSTEVAHYIVTAHPPGGVLLTTKCNFLSPNTTDVIIAKSRRLEIRQLASNTTTTTTSGGGESTSSPFPLVLSVPIHGRLTCMLPFRLPQSTTSFLFLVTDKLLYAVVSYQPALQPYPLQTHARGSFRQGESSLLGKEAECGPLVDLETFGRCIALHIYEGLITILPIHWGYKPPPRHQAINTLKGSGVGGRRSASSSSTLLGEPYHLRIEERVVMSLAFLKPPTPNDAPCLALLHRDARGLQHVMVHGMDLSQKQTWISGWKKSRVDGGSAKLIAVPPLTTATPFAAAAVAGSTNDEMNTTTKSTGPLIADCGLLILGQRQITYVQPTTTKVIPLSPCLLLAHTNLPPASSDEPRYLLGDDLGNLHMLTIKIRSGQVGSLHLDTLGATNVLASSLTYLEPSHVFCGSQLGDSLLIHIHSPEAHQQNMNTDDMAGNNNYLSIVEEHTNLGPIVHMDWIPTHNASVVTASGSSISGSLRVVRNGIGMKEYAGVEIPGIQGMWSLRSSFAHKEDKYLVQSFVGETRVLGVIVSGPSGGEETMQDGDEEAEEEEGATLEEVLLSGLESTASTLFVGNVQVDDSILQITEMEIRLLDASTFDCVSTWSPPLAAMIEDTSPPGNNITVASANESGQIVVALRGGLLLYLLVEDGHRLSVVGKKQMDQEVSCLDLNPFAENTTTSSTSMDVDSGHALAVQSQLVAVGLWDDFTVRVLSLEQGLDEILSIHLSTDEDEETEDLDGRSTVRRSRNNMMARSLCLVTLESSSSVPATSHSSSSVASSAGVNMLFVGLGDGTLISFAVVQQSGTVAVQSKKEVSLGTQRINLIPLQTELGGTCVLATGDRPTVIYLAGGINNSLTPKLCYSNVNLSTSDVEVDDMSRPPAQQSISVNVATPFHSPQLFDDASLGSKHYSLCVSDDSVLRLGVIDDIQKLHVTTCRLGMAPRRVVHCPEGRLFAVGCIESGIAPAGTRIDAPSMGNCVRFLDDTTFDDIYRLDLEPHETILSMVNVHMSVLNNSSTAGEESNPDGKVPAASPYLLIGTAYALADEDEATRGRILVMSCEDDEEGNANSNNGPAAGDNPNSATRGVRSVTELQVRGGVFSMCQFHDGLVLASVNSKTHVCRLSDDGGGNIKLNFVGIGHHGHLHSLYLKSNAPKMVSAPSGDGSNGNNASGNNPVDEPPVKKKAAKVPDKEQLAIVGDLMRSISLVQYYPEHQALEEIARDFNANWSTAIEMLTDGLYLGAENWNNLFLLRRNAKAASEEIRCRLDTVGEFHLGEMCNFFVRGSLVMPTTNSNGTGTGNSSNTAKSTGSSRTGNASASHSRRKSTSSSSAKQGRSGDKGSGSGSGFRARRPTVAVGSQTLFGTVDGTLGSILGLDARTAAFFTTLERSMAKTIPPVGGFSHQDFRTFDADGRVHPAHGFVDGDLVESFLDLDRGTMEAVVQEMNRDGGWEIESHNKSSKSKVATDDDEDETDMAADTAHNVLAVEDVLAMVEDMTMFH